MSTESIYNYRKVSDGVITGGQPTKEQLESAAQEGVDAVINLATFHRRYSLEDEAGWVQSLGMDYVNIPVNWENPQESDYRAFEEAMTRLGDRRVLIHCAANFRVTAFYALYGLSHLGWSESQAEDFRASIWMGSNYPLWEKFILEMKAKLAASAD